ncbi:MAG: PEP-CTERM sorting domain-containing protein [Calothrix sp. MO_167.B42]|nr:PEP-CTERM sorting domain-containing protein [Calothrix sp. MO_167.B42]
MRLKKLSIATAIAVTTTVGNIGLNPGQAAAANFVSEPTHINFDENVGVGDNPLDGGPKLDNLWSDYGLNMDSNKKELWLYDSSCKPGNGVSEDGFENKCTGGDRDLATGKGSYKKNGQDYTYDSEAQGQVLIVQENDGAPDDLAGGATITFDFTDELGVDFHDISLLDFDEPNDPVFKFTFLDGTVEELSFGEDADENDDRVTLLSQTWDGDPLKKDNSLRKYEFDFDKDVTKLELTLPGSGAVTNLNYTRKRRVPEPSSMLGLLVGAFGVVSVVKRGSGIRA